MKTIDEILDEWYPTIPDEEHNGLYARDKVKLIAQEFTYQFRQPAVMGSTHLIVLKDWEIPYNSVKKGNHAPAEYWASKLGKNTETFLMDFKNGYLDGWFKVYCP